MKKNNNGFTLVELLVVIGILGILAGSLFPAISSAMIKANMTAVKSKGRNIHMAIISTNTEREQIGLGDVWPKTKSSADSGDTDKDDINSTPYQNSTDYFWALYDGDNASKEDHEAVAADFNLGMLAGAGVMAHSGTSKLKKDNNMWTIGANIRDALPDFIPVLFTRNCSGSELYKKIEGTPSTTKMSNLGKDYATPFGNKGIVLVRKGGAAVDIKARYCTARVIYEGQSFDASTSDSDMDAFTYLSPEKQDAPQ